MNERQLIAIRNPCATPEEALAKQFHRAFVVGGLPVSTILTVNK